ncbi:MAG: hypothetical protein H7X99_04325, partial [Saprospiraceae bacterium]|nr:hypothetical protein [Saprospiraceae bacterium]
MRIILILFIWFIPLLSSLEAQNPVFRSGITFKKLFLDYQSQNGGNISNFKDYRHGMEIGYQRLLTNNIGISLPARYGVVESFRDSIKGLTKTILSLDLQFQYHFTAEGRRVIPYLTAGAGGVYETEGDFNIQFPVGIGFNFKLASNAFINIQSEFRYSLSENRNNLQHGLGFLYLFGKTAEPEPVIIPEEIVKPDSDNDGIIDELDLCPNAFGSREMNGCPDKDGDNIADYLDKCPDQNGLKEFNGCPDSDADGVSDNEDECPKVAG